MPRPTLKIVGSQRDALYEQVRNHLAGLGDVVVALECQKDYPHGRAIGDRVRRRLPADGGSGLAAPGRPGRG
jgi:hypothetical protein